MTSNNISKFSGKKKKKNHNNNNQRTTPKKTKKMSMAYVSDRHQYKNEKGTLNLNLKKTFSDAFN